jgi:ferritin
MIITKKIEKLLNDHLSLEMGAVYSYLAVASWSEKEGLEGAANFFYLQSDEERAHFRKFFSYINEVGGHALVPEMKQPKSTFNSVLEACELSLTNEQKVTKSIYKIVELARNEGDHGTVEFLKFFIDEQREEEVQFQRIIDKIKLIGKGAQSLYYIDKELEKIATTKVKTSQKEAKA